MSTLPKVSNAGLWSHCPASHKMSGQFKNPFDNEEARLKGIAEHEEASDLITKGGTSSNKYVQMYVDDFRARLGDTSFPFGVEQSFECEEHGLKIKTRIDAWSYNPNTNTVTIYEYKSGKSPVYAKENRQMLMETCIFLKVNPQYEHAKFEFRVIQPRIRRQPNFWSINGANLREWSNFLFGMYIKACSPNAECTTGTWCFKCFAFGHCRASREAQLYAISFTDYAIIDDRDLAAVGADYKVLRSAEKYIKKMADALEFRLTNAIKAGVQVIGYSLNSGRSTVSWCKTIEEVKALGILYNVKMEKKNSLITPKQAVALGIPESIVMMYAKEEQGSLKLTEDNTFKEFT